MGRSPCCVKERVNRGAWTSMEDHLLTHYVQLHGEGNWRNLSKKAGLKRCGKSCRLRWLNYLRPGIKRGNITDDEEELIIRLHNLLGNRWSLIAGRLPGRTDNEIKNYWNTIIEKKLKNHRQNLSSPSNQSDQEKPNLSNNDDKSVHTCQKIMNVNSNVVRTRASKCNKVVMSPDLHNIGNHQSQVEDKDTMLMNAPPSSLSETESLISKFNSEVNNLSNSMIDFQINEPLLSNLLDIYFSPSTNFNNGIVSDTTSICNQNHPSLNSSRTLLFSDDALYNPSKFPLMDSSIESKFDWLVD